MTITYTLLCDKHDYNDDDDHFCSFISLKTVVERKKKAKTIIKQKQKITS